MDVVRLDSEGKRIGRTLKCPNVIELGRTASLSAVTIYAADVEGRCSMLVYLMAVHTGMQASKAS